MGIARSTDSIQVDPATSNSQIAESERRRSGQVRFEEVSPKLNKRVAITKISREQRDSERGDDGDVSHDDQPWALSVTLSLDGGGIRGYWQLMVLQRLMEEVEKYERADDSKATSSLHPLHDTPSTREDATRDASTDFLPCHYFDFIGGSSTGGVIAIMLGRLRMSVQRAFHDYENFCRTLYDIRKAPSLRAGTWPRGKRSAGLVQTGSKESQTMILKLEQEVFKFDAKQCKTFVYCLRTTKQSGTLQVLRSYSGSRAIDRHDHKFGSGVSEHLSVWDVCRATSAPLHRFDPPEKEINGEALGDPGTLLANPTLEVVQEIRTWRGNERPVGVLLSIGIDGDHQLESARFGKLLLRGKNTRDEAMSLSRSARVHAQVKEMEQNGEVKNYYRLSITLGISEIDQKDLANLAKLRQKLNIDERLEAKPFLDNLKQCARQLVKLRQDRSRTTRWESFATGSRYRCPKLEQCPPAKKEITYETRTGLLNHLLSDHQMDPPDSVHEKEVHETLDSGRIVEP